MQDVTASSIGESVPRRVIFLMLPEVHLLDLGGPAQVFHEANEFGAAYEVIFAATQPELPSAQGLKLAGLKRLPEPTPRDLILIPGVDSRILGEMRALPIDWLNLAYACGATLCSICSGAFVLARAGLLNGRQCTTHWKNTQKLADFCPAAKVLENRLFVQDDRIVTSAGVAAGIDMTLFLVEADYGTAMVARVARELVIYMRRNGAQGQNSAFLNFRTHLHPGIHRVQDWLIDHPDQKPTLSALGKLVGMSPRNLTRLFRQSTGVTLKAFANELKLELASNLLKNPDLSMDLVAQRCGFEDPRQLRRLWKRAYGEAPSKSRRLKAGRES